MTETITSSGQGNGTPINDSKPVGFGFGFGNGFILNPNEGYGFGYGYGSSNGYGCNKFGYSEHGITFDEANGCVFSSGAGFGTDFYQIPSRLPFSPGFNL